MQPEKLPPWIDYSKWDETSLEYFLKAAKQNMDELQDDLNRLQVKYRALLAFMGTSFSLFIAMLSLDTSAITFWTFFGFVPMFIAIFLMIFISVGTQHTSVMDFLIGQYDDFELKNSPERMRVDLINGFLWRCEEAKDTLEKTGKWQQISVTIFMIGVALFILPIMMSVLGWT